MGAAEIFGSSGRPVAREGAEVGSGKKSGGGDDMSE